MGFYSHRQNFSAATLSETKKITAEKSWGKSSQKEKNNNKKDSTFHGDVPTFDYFSTRKKMLKKKNGCQLRDVKKQMFGLSVCFTMQRFATLQPPSNRYIKDSSMDRQKVFLTTCFWDKHCQGHNNHTYGGGWFQISHIYIFVCFV